MTIKTVGGLIRELKKLDPKTPVLRRGQLAGFFDRGIETATVELQEIDGAYPNTRYIIDPSHKIWKRYKGGNRLAPFKGVVIG